MKRIGKILLLMVCFTTVVGSIAADNSTAERVVLRVRAAIDAPEVRSSVASTIISEIGEGYQKEIELRNYKLNIGVTDRRDQEFSIRLDLVDSNGAVIDSLTVLASPSNPAEFEFSSDRVTSTGEIEVGDVITQHKNE